MSVVGRLLAGIAAALISSGVSQALRFLRESKRRQRSPLQFTEQLTQEDFNALVEEIARVTPRLTHVTTSGLITTMDVRSNSGLTSWKAVIDFNDFGSPTGRYWIHAENKQSPIPEFFAKKVQSELHRRFDASAASTAS